MFILLNHINKRNLYVHVFPWTLCIPITRICFFLKLHTPCWLFILLDYINKPSSFFYVFPKATRVFPSLDFGSFQKHDTPCWLYYSTKATKNATRVFPSQFFADCLYFSTIPTNASCVSRVFLNATRVFPSLVFGFFEKLHTPRWLFILLNHINKLKSCFPCVSNRDWCVPKFPSLASHFSEKLHTPRWLLILLNHINKRMQLVCFHHSPLALFRNSALCSDCLFLKLINKRNSTCVVPQKMIIHSHSSLIICFCLNFIPYKILFKKCDTRRKINTAKEKWVLWNISSFCTTDIRIITHPESRRYLIIFIS